MWNQVYSYLQGPVPKMWTIHTATHALKLLTELKEYTDMKKNTNNRHKRSWSVCISPMCFQCIEYFNSSIMTNGYYYINKVCQVCSSISKGNKLSAIFFYRSIEYLITNSLLMTIDMSSWLVSIKYILMQFYAWLHSTTTRPLTKIFPSITYNKQVIINTF